ncbi:hypothetical protein [Bosea vaviloviae]|uniref:hypothetical protein n=1 Tax=Bosea vaviloviae TaxID=1526658 RepID=UPI0011DFC1A8|nr:hypothetical protein [Bosea vaviloviae]
MRLDATGYVPKATNGSAGTGFDDTCRSAQAHRDRNALMRPTKHRDPMMIAERSEPIAGQVIVCDSMIVCDSGALCTPDLTKPPCRRT